MWPWAFLLSSGAIAPLLWLSSPFPRIYSSRKPNKLVPGENPSHKVINSKGKEKMAYPEWISALLCLSHWILLERKYIKEDKQKVVVTDC